MTDSASTQTTASDVRARSIRLFSYLLEVEKFRSTPVRNLVSYGSTTPPGAVLWLGELPDTPEVRSVLNGRLASDSDTLLEVDRTDLPAPPPLPAALSGRVDHPDSADLDQPPALRPDPESDGRADWEQELFREWLRHWRTWADEVTRIRPIRHLYRQLFQLYERIDQYPEDLEAVIGAGCLSWQPEDHAGVQRHLAVMPALVTFNAESGLLTLAVPPTRDCSIELDMLDPKKHPRPAIFAEVEGQLAELETSVLDQAAVDRPIRVITHGLTDEAVYLPDAVRPVSISSRAQVAFAPAFVVRKRTNDRKLRVLGDIIDALSDEHQPIPEGVASIVVAIDLDVGEPELDPATDLDIVESYLPLPANRPQQEIVWSVEHRRHTVVQGPPGTGKTHTIANVLSHLLATGRRVLITAHTERALKEVRSRLPERLRDLAIAVIGQGRDEKADLDRSVRQMTSYADGYRPAAEHERIAELESLVDTLRRQQASIRADLVQARVNDVETTTVGAYHGKPADIAQQLAEEATLHGWLEDVGGSSDPLLPNEERERLLMLLRRIEIDQRADELDQPLPDLHELPRPDQLAATIAGIVEADARAAAAEIHQRHLAYSGFANLEDERRRRFAEELRGVAIVVREVRARPEPWIDGLLRQLAAGKPGLWKQRAEELGRALDRCAHLMETAGRASVRIEPGVPRDGLLAQATQLREHLAGGGTIRKRLNAKVVRSASELLTHVLVDGLPPRDIGRVEAFIAHATLHDELERADKLWPSSLAIPPEDTFTERLAWHRAEHHVLVRALTAGERLLQLQHDLTQAGVPQPDWTDPQDIAVFADVASEPDIQIAAKQAHQPLLDLVGQFTSTLDAPLLSRLRDSVQRKEVASYGEVYATIAELRDLLAGRNERDQLLARLRISLPRTAEKLKSNPQDPAWDQRLDQLDRAYAWASARRELQRRLDDDQTDDLMRALDDASRRLQETILDLTVAKSWAHTVDRLTPQQRRRLNTYALLAKNLPKGGKYRARKLREVQDALRLCRDAVPAWVMPINYVADVLSIDPDAFDVVIVDEASQAGMDATFLQYLAPKMIVIGDDLQVSPTAFVDRSELHRLADDLLFDFEDKALWSNPETSLFDHATNRFGKRITLVEHFRCMPEIIGFSQRFIYEVNGVHLRPLRQYGAQRLKPVKTVHVPEGYRRGKVNPPEVDVVVELVAKCTIDPQYEFTDDNGRLRKKSFGVISLTGSDQAKHIDLALLERIGEQEYAERDIRCGDAADFQGSERKVIFLSMVEAQPEDGSRIRKRGDKATYQRINVAASRAEDQMWLIHSVLPEQLHPDDIRHDLLTYCLSTERQFGAYQYAVPAFADETARDDRFDSLFEQRVFNRIVDRGYAVQPQVPVGDYRIDLVVMGQESRIAVECDGDKHHGPDQFAQDVARQRDLERAGWTFFRVRASVFYSDRQGALEPLWPLLESHRIFPVVPQQGADDQGGYSHHEPERVAREPAEQGQGFRHGDGHESRHDDAMHRVPPTRTRRNAKSDSPASKKPADDQTLVAVEDATGEVEDAHVTLDRGAFDPSGSDFLHLELGPADSSLRPYRHWDTSTHLPDPSRATLRELRDSIQRIVEIEGPVLGERLYRLYVKSARGSKVGSALRRTFNRATAQMERDGTLASDDPLREGGQIHKTFRMPTQPPFIVRERGDRTIHEIPPLELAARLRAVRRRGEAQEDTFRRVLAGYQLSKLTSKTRRRLTDCSTLIMGEDL